MITIENKAKNENENEKVINDQPTVQTVEMYPILCMYVQGVFQSLQSFLFHIQNQF